ncbi:MAG: hypothetical protein GXY58_19365 [Planctomycetaceae bacterium]|nr:hypothetical protein [Planctomycetaceae bacterium]
MHDRIARQIRDLLMVMVWIHAGMLAIIILMALVVGYWHFKVDAARQRLLDAPPPAPVSQAAIVLPTELSLRCLPAQPQSGVSPSQRLADT